MLDLLVFSLGPYFLEVKLVASSFYSFKKEANAGNDCYGIIILSRGKNILVLHLNHPLVFCKCFYDKGD